MILLFDTRDKLHRVSVKTSRRKEPSKNYIFDLRTIGANSTEVIAKAFDKTKVDLLFLLGGDGSQYIMPSETINDGQQTISPSLTGRYAQYFIGALA